MVLFSNIGGVLLLAVIGVVFQTSEILAESGVSIGSLYQCAHDLRGSVYVKNEREIVIQGFNYDGKGPSAWFHGQKKGAKGVYTSDHDYVTIPYPDASCNRLKPGRQYTDENVTVILPISIKEFETIGIFCYEYCHNFGHIVIPADLKVPAAPADLLQPSECPHPKYNACTMEKTKHSKTMADCTAGAAQISPFNAVTILVGWVIALIVIRQN